MFWIRRFSSALAFVSYLFPTGLQPENETMRLYMRCQTALHWQHLRYIKEANVYFHQRLNIFTCSAQPSVLHLE